LSCHASNISFLDRQPRGDGWLVRHAAISTQHARRCWYQLTIMMCTIRRLYRKSESESKNMTSDFAPEVAKYPQNPPNSPK